MPRASLYAWRKEGKDECTLYLMEQPYADAAQWQREFAEVWQRLRNDHTNRLRDKVGWEGDASALFGAPARYSLCEYSQLHVLVQKDGALLHLMQRLRPTELKTVDDYGRKKQEEVRRDLELKDFNPAPSGVVMESLRRMADLARRWSPPYAGQTAPGENAFYTLLGRVDESPRCPALWENARFTWTDFEHGLNVRVETQTSAWPSDNGWAERHELEDYYSSSRRGGGGISPVLLGYALFKLAGESLDFSRQRAPSPTRDRHRVRQLNGLYGLEEVRYYTKKKADSPVIYDFYARWEHFGNFKDTHLPYFKITLEGDTAQPEAFMGLWDALLESVRPNDPRTVPVYVRPKRGNFSYEEHIKNEPPRWKERGKKPWMTDIDPDHYAEPLSCVNKAFGR